MRPVLVLALLARTAAADTDAETLVAGGEALARTGEYTRAIALFKQADALKPSAHHACLIGLVYTRRELWSQAEIYFDRCKQGATAADPLPDWFADAAKQLDEKLHAAGIAEVDIRVVPATAHATIAISSFPPDETFAPRKIHIVPGTYNLTITAPGYHVARETVTPTPGAPTIVTVTLDPVHKPPADFSLPLYIGAAAFALGGVTFHVLALHEKSALDDAFAADDVPTFTSHQGSFETDRAVAVGCYAGAVVVAALGWYVHHRHVVGVEATLATSTSGTPVFGIAVHR